MKSTEEKKIQELFGLFDPKAYTQSKEFSGVLEDLASMGFVGEQTDFVPYLKDAFGKFDVSELVESPYVELSTGKYAAEALEHAAIIAKSRRRWEDLGPKDGCFILARPVEDPKGIEYVTFGVGNPTSDIIEALNKEQTSGSGYYEPESRNYDTSELNQSADYHLRNLERLLDRSQCVKVITGGKVYEWTDPESQRIPTISVDEGKISGTLIIGATYESNRCS
jgi:hypothetical protein